MKVSEEKDVALGYLVEENTYGTTVECSKCESTALDKEGPVFCPSCKEELFYRPWWSW